MNDLITKEKLEKKRRLFRNTAVFFSLFICWCLACLFAKTNLAFDEHRLLYILLGVFSSLFIYGVYNTIRVHNQIKKKYPTV